MASKKLKQAFYMVLAKILFDPEIFFEDKSIQGRILNEPFVVICNHSVRVPMHLANLDGPIIRYAFKNKNICSLMGADLMEQKLNKVLVNGCDCIPVRRDAASRDWLYKCREKLENGVSVVIFPEGTTLKDKPVDTFKSGFALLAKTADVKVLPVTINGVYKILSRKKLKVRIGIPEKLQLEKGNSRELKEEAKRFQEIIEKMHSKFE